MERILIIGGNGAGKSTFSYELEKKLGFPLVHLDQIYWHGRWKVTPHEEFLERVEAEAKKERWIIEGNNVRSLHQRLQYADTLIWFEFPPMVCVTNILKREWKYRKKVRPDMPDDCVSRVDVNFLKIAWQFNKKNRARILEQINQAEHVKVIRFTNYRQVREFLDGIETEEAFTKR